MLAASGDNPRLDLGASFIAAHRVGAAACEYASRQPLLDERGLIECLVAARERVVPAMINSVSKSVEGPEYGALLVRDFFDDAEEAALELFRQARARGVAAPVAAARTGDIFGVAKSDLGRYRMLALDPKTSPAVLADEGDRTLFRFIEKLVSDEADDRVVVSKITPEERRRLVAEQPRDAEGQFASLHRGLQAASLNLPETESGDGDAGRRPPTVPVSPGIDDPGRLADLRRRLGGGGGAAPRVVGETAEEVAERERVARAERIRVRRKRREAREQRAAAEQAAAQRQRTAQPADRQVQGQRAVTGSRAVRGGRRRVSGQRRIQERLGYGDQSLLPQLREAPREQPSGLPLWAEPVDIGYDDAGEATVPYQQAVVMSSEDASAFNQKVSARPGRLFRVNELIDLAGPNATMRPGPMPREGKDFGAEHEGAVELVAETAEGVEPDVEIVNPRRFQSMIGHTNAEVEQFLINEAEASNLGVKGQPPIPYQGLDGNWYMINSEDVIQAPRVFEIVIEGGSGIMPTHEDTVWQLNPNEFYALDEQQYAQDYWDPRGFFRTRITARRVSEASARETIRSAAEEPWSGGKADTHWRYQPRDEQGQWTDQAIQGIREVEHQALHESLRDAAAQQTPPTTRSTKRTERRQRREQREAREAREVQQRGTPVAQPGTPNREVRGTRSVRGVRQVRGRRQLSAEGRRHVQRVTERVRQVIAQSNAQAHPSRTELDVQANERYAVLSQDDFHSLLAAVGGTQNARPGALAATFSSAPIAEPSFTNATRGLFPEEIVIHGTAREHVDAANTPGEDVTEWVTRTHLAQGTVGERPMPMTYLGHIPASGEDAETAGGRVRVLDELMARPSVSLVREIPDKQDASSVALYANSRPQPPVVVVELDGDLAHAASYVLQYTGQAHVSDAQMFDDGEVEQYVVPVVHYRQIPWSSAFNERSYDEGE